MSDYLVLGLGKTGISAIKFLQKRGFSLIATDTRVTPSNLKSWQETTPCPLVAFSPKIPAPRLAVVLSPGIDPAQPEVKKLLDSSSEVLNDIELFYRFYPNAPTIAITGTNGKSTLTAMLAHLLCSLGKPAFALGNIGTPLLEHEFQKNDILVLELSSFNLERLVSMKPQVACILNITPDHQDRYKDFAEYVETKKRIFRHAKSLVCNSQDPLTWPDSPHKKIVYWSSTESNKQDEKVTFWSNGQWIFRHKQALLDTTNITPNSKLQRINSLAALAIIDCLGFDSQQAALSFKSFTPLPHRLKLQTYLGGKVPVYTDSKATNLGALRAILQGFSEEQKLLLILGGDAKSCRFDDAQLLQEIDKKVRILMLFGKDREQIAADTAGLGITTQIHHKLEDICSSIGQLYGDKALDGMSILFAPGCASTDQFTDYQARGDFFHQALQKLEADLRAREA